MYNIYCKIRDEKGYKDSDVSKGTNITKSTFSAWKKGTYQPKQEKLQKIADFLNVSLEYLMTGEEKDSDSKYYLNDETAEIAQEIFENKDLRSLFDMSRKMPPERLKAHLEFMKKLEEQENK